MDYIYNALNEDCPSRKVLDLIADKWTVLVFHGLASDKRRYGELLRAIEGISKKMLTQTLRQLEGDGLINRTVFPVVPPKVEYNLTPLGESLLEQVLALKRWAETHMPEVELARTRQIMGDTTGVTNAPGAE